MEMCLIELAHVHVPVFLPVGLEMRTTFRFRTVSPVCGCALASSESFSISHALISATMRAPYFLAFASPKGSQ